MNAQDEETNLNLTPWLRKKLEEQVFDGLIWFDKNQRLFRISWPEKEKPDFPLLLEVCGAWAKHKRKTQGSDQKLKDRFRDTIRKSNYIEEVKEFSVLNRQTGNYRVFKFLTEIEAEEKKRKRASSHDKHTPKADNQVRPLSSLTPLMSDSQETVADYNVVDMECDGGSVFQADAVNHPGSSCTNFVLSPSNCSLSSSSPKSQTITEDLFSNDVPRNCMSNSDATSTHESNRKLAGSIVATFNCEEMSKFKVTVRYGRDTFDPEVFNLSDGIRFHYGSAYWQNQALDAIPRLLGDKQDFEYPSKEFPRFDNGKSPTIQKVLDSASGGIILKSSNAFELWGKRLSQSRIFYNDSSELPIKIIKMERKVPTLLFSYESYIKHLLDYSDNLCKHLPEDELLLSIGTLPKSSISSTLACLILEPVLVPKIKKRFNIFTDSIELSSETSVDRVIRVFEDME